MADYYSEYGPTGKKQRRSLFMGTLDLLLTLLTGLVAATMSLTLIVPYVNPGSVWFFPILGLAAPAVYGVTVVLALYWLVRWRVVRAAVMLLLVVLGLFKVSLFYKPELLRIYEKEATSDRGTFKLMTYNVRYFYGPDGQSSLPDVLRLIEREDPDIICLQEFNSRLSEQNRDFALLDEKYEKALFGRTEAPDSIYAAPLVVLSKYRILRRQAVLSPSTSVWVDVLIGEDTVRIFNNHLRSTAINAKDDEYITRGGYLSDTARDAKIRSIVERYRSNSILRATQVDSIAAVIRATPTRKIVCGDFNDTPMSYVYRTMAHGLNDAFSECGRGYSHTFRGFFNTLRIDFVLSSDGLEPLSYDVLEADFSDHHPVLVQLKKSTFNN